MARIKLGVNAMHDVSKGGDGRVGVVVSQMTVVHDGDTPDEQRVKLRYEYPLPGTDPPIMGSAEAWYEESAVTELA